MSELPLTIISLLPSAVLVTPAKLDNMRDGSLKLPVYLSVSATEIDQALMIDISLIASPFVLLGLALYGVGTILWLFALKQLDLSLAYPFVGMSFLFVLVFSIAFLQEPFSLNRFVGTIVIVFGISL